jgi:hypothetical protein
MMAIRLKDTDQKFRDTFILDEKLLFFWVRLNLYPNMDMCNDCAATLTIRGSSMPQPVYMHSERIKIFPTRNKIQCLLYCPNVDMVETSHAYVHHRRRCSKRPSF